MLDHMHREGPGWDVLHFSGHGLASRLVLECEDGSPDFIDATELLDLLRPARGRLKWVTLSACLSAAATVEETLRWLGLEPRRRDAGSPADEPPADRARPHARCRPRTRYHRFAACTVSLKAQPTKTLAEPRSKPTYFHLESERMRG